jgi:hypothetical protein
MDNTAKLFSILDVVADTSKYILIHLNFYQDI